MAQKQDYSISSFLSTFDNGISYANRFRVVCDFPSSISGSDLTKLNLMCESTSIPAFRVSTTEERSNKFITKIPYAFEKEDASFVFILDGSYDIKKMFDDWIDLIISSTTGQIAYKKDIVVNSWEVWQQNRNNEDVAGVKLYNVFPIQLNEVQFNNSSKDYQKLSVSVSFEYREIQ